MAIQKTLSNNPQKDDSKKNTTEAYYKRLIENMGKQIATLKNQEQARLRLIEAQPRLIRKPPGQSGRKTGGFNLVDAMGISKDLVNKIRMVVRTYAGMLDLTKTWSHQNAMAIRKVQVMVTSKLPIMKVYDQYWPINEMIRQMLISTSSSFSKAVASINESKETPRPRTNGLTPQANRSMSGEEFEGLSDASGSEDENEDVQEKKQKRYKKGKDDGDDSAEERDENGDVNMHNTKTKLSNGVVPKKVQFRIDPVPKRTQDKRKIQDSDKNIPEASEKGKEKALPLKRKSTVVSDEDNDEEDQTPPPRKAKAEKRQRVSSDEDDSDDSSKGLSQSPEEDGDDEDEDEEEEEPKTGYPTACPVEVCEENHKFPAMPDQQLLGAYQEYEKALEMKLNKKPANLNFATYTVCLEITGHYKREASVMNGSQLWPSEIDFESLGGRVAGFTQILDGLIDNSIVLSNCEAWKSFLLDLNEAEVKLQDFSSLNAVSRLTIIQSASAGYYGGLGKGIIGAALRHLVYRRGGKSDTDLKNELTSTIGEVVSNHHDSCITMEGFWDLPPHSNIEIRLEDFFDFIALPHTVNLLIMEDMKLSNETDANEARRTSTIFGEAVHPEPTDETMDNMILEISRGQRQPQKGKDLDVEIAQGGSRSVIPPRLRKKKVVDAAASTSDTVLNAVAGPSNAVTQPAAAAAVPYETVANAVVSSSRTVANAVAGPSMAANAAATKKAGSKSKADKGKNAKKPSSSGQPSVTPKQPKKKRNGVNVLTVGSAKTLRRSQRKATTPEEGPEED